MSDKPLEKGWRTVRGRRIFSSLATVSPRYATLYRRAFHGLGLVEDIPGIWNPEGFHKPKFDHDAIADEHDGYAEYTDWSDLNTPAELNVLTDDSDAYRQATEGYDVYVLSRNWEAEEGHDNKGVAYGDIEATKSVWFLSDSPSLVEGHALSDNGVQSQRDYTTHIYPCHGTDVAHPPSTVLLVERREFRWSRRSRPDGCLMASMQRPLSVPELQELTGIPRRTIYDKISKGAAIKIEDGKYWCICHDYPH